MNNVQLIGRTTKDIELKHTQSNIAVVSFTLAVNKPFANEQGERQADFIQCVAWRKTAELLAEHVKKGHQIGLTGRLQVRSFENSEGTTVYATEVLVDQLTFLENKGKEQAPRDSVHGQERVTPEDGPEELPF